MSNRVIEWARRQCADWERSIALMESGRMTTGERRDGKQVDTTTETILDRKQRIVELKTIIQQHEAKNA